MFTGIITHLATLYKKEGSIFTFKARQSFCKKIKKGTSVAINGACLAVIRKPSSNVFLVEVMPETIKKTTLGKLTTNTWVNLELPMTLNNFFSGHIVQGHIDGTGTIKKIEKKGNSRIVTIHIATKLNNYIVEKGSIAVNGISLTIIHVNKTHFTIGIIPYTWKHTMLQHITIGDRVNIEVDVLAKYLEKLLKKEQSV